MTFLPYYDEFYRKELPDHEREAPARKPTEPEQEPGKDPAKDRRDVP